MLVLIHVKRWISRQWRWWRWKKKLDDEEAAHGGGSY
jgi:hypothetical protein